MPFSNVYLWIKIFVRGHITILKDDLEDYFTDDIEKGSKQNSEDKEAEDGTEEEGKPNEDGNDAASNDGYS